jgi:heme/copper-type cytochrome/quinol oxidase subunit 3
VISSEIIIFPSLFAALLFSIKAIVDARARTKLLESHSQEHLVQSILKEEERRRRYSALRWGIVLVFLAAGFMVVELENWDHPSPGVLAVLLGTTGLGNIVSYFVCRKLEETDSAAGARSAG